MLGPSAPVRISGWRFASTPNFARSDVFGEALLCPAVAAAGFAAAAARTSASLLTQQHRCVVRSISTGSQEVRAGVGFGARVCADGVGALGLAVVRRHAFQVERSHPRRHQKVRAPANLPLPVRRITTRLAETHSRLISATILELTRLPLPQALPRLAPAASHLRARSAPVVSPLAVARAPPPPPARPSPAARCRQL